MSKILVAEDDLGLADVIRERLMYERHVVEVANDGEAALELLNAYDYDLIILDWQMPRKTGIEVVRAYRAKGGQTPILMLTGKNTLDDKEAGFESGADDYLTKPFQSRELVMRVKALLRRPVDYSGGLLKIGALSLDNTAHKVCYHDKDVQLSPKEFSMLEEMMKHPGQVFSAAALLDRVWGGEEDVAEDTVRVVIKRVRQKLGEPSPIQTVHGVGYKLDVPE